MSISPELNDGVWEEQCAGRDEYPDADQQNEQKTGY